MTAVDNLSLEVRAGEIVGVAGVEGNGQRELADSIMGLRPLEGGAISLDGLDLQEMSTQEIRNSGVAFVPEDRHDQGLVLDMTIWENTVIGRHDDAGRDRPLSGEDAGYTAVFRLDARCLAALEHVESFALGTPPNGSGFSDRR